VIYGAGGAVGGAVARTFAREGAKVFLAGRMLNQSIRSPRRSLPMEALSKSRR
jgi:NADP-dependent 3-hydroxy acid dehydrogenase YdfG